MMTMKKYLLAAVAAVALGGVSYATPQDEEYACMHYGPISSQCEMYLRQDEMENRMRQLVDCNSSSNLAVSAGDERGRPRFLGASFKGRFGE
jgi:hypothetical protein